MIETALTTTTAAPLAAVQTMRQDDNPAAVYLASLPSAGSRRVMAQALGAIADILAGQYAAPIRSDFACAAEYRAARQAYNARGLLFAHWHELRYQHTAALRTHLIEHYSPASAARMLAALRGVLKECWRLGLMPAEEYRRAVDLRPITPTGETKGRALTPRDADRLLHAWDGEAGALAARNRAVVAVLLLTGIRRAELAALRWTDIDIENGVITIRSGKGGKGRTVSVYGETALTALTQWHMYLPSGYQTVFVRVQKGGGIGPDQPISTTAVYTIVTQAARAAGIEAKPHDLRRTLITEILATGGSLQDAQAQAGHKQGNTTMKYAYAVDARKRRAAARLRFG